VKLKGRLDKLEQSIPPEITKLWLAWEDDHTPGLYHLDDKRTSLKRSWTPYRAKGRGATGSSFKARTTMKLRARLDKLKVACTVPVSIEVWLFDLDGTTATGPDGRRYTAQEAERRQADSDLVIDVRRKP
jgi:hypothetical protein